VLKVTRDPENPLSLLSDKFRPRIARMNSFRVFLVSFSHPSFLRLYFSRGWKPRTGQASRWRTFCLEHFTRRVDPTHFKHPDVQTRSPRDTTMGLLPPCNLRPGSSPYLYLHPPATLFLPTGRENHGGSAFHTRRGSHTPHLIVFPTKMVNAHPFPPAIRLRRRQQSGRTVTCFRGFQAVRYITYGERDERN